MIRITSFLHRDVLYDAIRRWMSDDVRPGDAMLLTRLVAFNNAFISRYLTLFSTRLFARLNNGTPLSSRPTLVKGDLKDVIVVRPPASTPRIQEMIAEYRAHPERYYRETPFSARLFFMQDPAGERYIGSHRIKRVRRLAEKSARRIIDRIFEAIKARADSLADDRARRLGITRESLITRQEDMVAEFTKAECKLLDDLRHRRAIPTDGDLVINDVAGVKVITEAPEARRLVEVVCQTGDCEAVEVEPHRGRYNATNVILSYTPPKDEVLAIPLGEGLLKLMRSRGLDTEGAQRAFAEFVHSGESKVHIEVILCSYQEMLESEIGRCMHEDRIIEQRMRQEYHGSLAKNVEYLMEYLFAFAISPQTEMDTLPIKLWNRYLPDYFDDCVKKLWEIPPMHFVD